MKRAVIRGKGDAALVDAPKPEARENWAVVKVHAAPMCTEYKGFVSGTPGEYLGHEAAGEVVVGAGRVKAGDRVVVMPLYPCGTCPLCLSGDYIHCEHSPDFARFTGSREGSATMAQYLLKTDWLLLPIPDGVSYEHASLACCALGPSFGAYGRMNVSALDTVLITGLGPVGLGAVVNARYRGARVIGVEGNPWRAERARQMGAELVLDPGDETAPAQVRGLTDGRGADCGLDCSGSPHAHRFLIDAVRRRGRIAFVGECSAETVLRMSPDMIRKGLTLIGSWHYNLGDFPGVIQVVQRSPLIGLLVSHVLPMSRIQEAFETLAGQETAKVILKPWE
ncbi:MAG TPA: zinc-binding dehydrogenase [Armatimonadota bacterium]|nr:zinc-binding dehydrogenase [Armatimonadota bacterium]